MPDIFPILIRKASLSLESPPKLSRLLSCDWLTCRIDSQHMSAPAEPGESKMAANMSHVPINTL